MSDVTYHQGDTIPLEAKLPVSLGNATAVTFELTHEKQTIVDDTAQITDTDNGVVVYDFNDGDTDQTGVHYIHWVIEWSDGDTETFPRDDGDTLYIYE